MYHNQIIISLKFPSPLPSISGSIFFFLSTQFFNYYFKKINKFFFRGVSYHIPDKMLLVKITSRGRMWAVWTSYSTAWAQQSSLPGKLGSTRQCPAGNWIFDGPKLVASNMTSLPVGINWRCIADTPELVLTSSHFPM